jgi:DNA-directed RNA polymerase specialized sigma24 family protein
MIDPLKSSASNYESNPKNKKIIRPLEELMLEMSLKDDERETALKAFNETIRRFQAYLLTTGRRALFRNNTYDPADLDALVNNTFLHLYNNAENLLHIEALETEAKKESVIKSWLGTVAGREAAKINGALDEYYKKIVVKDFTERNREPGINDDVEDEPVPEKIKIETFDEEKGKLSVEEINLVIDDDEGESLSTDEMIVFTEVLNECTPREQEIILTYYDYLEGRKHLPHEESQRLCNKFGILPDNLNHIKNRTFKKLKSECLRRIAMRNPGYSLRE